jgi:hypothetical protein
VADEFIVEILPDGRIKATTGAISGPSHLAAEQFFAFLQESLGVPVTRERRAGVAAHVHDHGHDHEHEH